MAPDGEEEEREGPKCMGGGRCLRCLPLKNIPSLTFVAQLFEAKFADVFLPFLAMVFHFLSFTAFWAKVSLFGRARESPFYGLANSPSSLLLLPTTSRTTVVQYMLLLLFGAKKCRSSFSKCAYNRGISLSPPAAPASLKSA